MRKFNSFVLSKLQEDPVKFFPLIFLDFRNGPVYLSAGPHEIDFNGKTYTKDLGIIDYVAPLQSALVDRQTFSISFADNNAIFKNNVSRTEAGRAAKIYFGFYNSDGTPNTDPANVILAYSGVIDDHSYNNDFDQAVFSITLSSPFADLGLVKTLITSPKGMDQINTSDTAFDKVLEDNEQIIKWGKV